MDSRLALDSSCHLHVVPTRIRGGSVPNFLRAQIGVLSTGLARLVFATFLFGWVSVVAHAQSGQWSWINGSSGNNVAGTYGTLGTPAAGNMPGSRRYATNWVDNKGNLWLFGGDGYDASGNENDLNDLWEFDVSVQEWVWMGGDDVVPCNAGSVCPAYHGVYGQQGVAAAGNAPGGRTGATGWTDKNGNLWLFGGVCIDSTGDDAWCNDLWMYNTTAHEWTWVNGSNVQYTPSVFAYGTLGVADPANIPPGRMGAVGWTDKNGNLWLFSGHAYVVYGVGTTYTNDLWMFNVSTNEWTWMSGQSAYPCTTANGNCDGALGVYGTLGVPAAENYPGARWFASGWKDRSGNFWVFGGEGNASDANNFLNDLWEYNPSTSEWTWMGGSNTAVPSGGPNGVYGTLGAPAPGNAPGGREYGSSWTDSGGNFWLMGGLGFAANGGESYLNDLWVYCPAVHEWTWFGGSNTGNPIGIYLQRQATSEESGVTGPEPQGSGSNPIPGGRAYSESWIDASGHLWLFGGEGDNGFLNDLWEYAPPATDSPTFSVPAGNYNSTQSVSITDATANAQIYYTTDGSTPTSSSALYSGAINVEDPQTLQAVAYAAGYTPSGVAVAGYTFLGIWIADGGGGTSELGADGGDITTGQDPGVGTALAIDNGGDVWTVGPGTPALEETSAGGSLLQQIDANTGGLNAPSAIAIDGNNRVWIANGNNTVSLFTNGGTALSPVGGFTSTTLSVPSGIAIDVSGSVWVTNKSNNSVTRILGAAAPVAPIATSVAKGTTGAKP